MHSTKRTRRCGALLFALAIGYAHARQDTPNSVEITGLKDPGLLPYKIAYQILSKASKAESERAGMEVRAYGKATGEPVPGLQVSLVGDTRSQPVAIDAAGRMQVPLDRALLDDKADFMSNRKRGTLMIRLQLTPRLPADNLRYGDLLDSIDAGRKVVRELTPWYKRIGQREISKVGICYRDDRQAVAVAGAPEPGTRTASTPDPTRPGEHPVWCAVFGRDEAGLSRDTIITPAPGWVPVFL